MTVRTIDDIFRDFTTDGVPASGAHHPYKPDIRDTLKKLLEGHSTIPDNRIIRLNNANAGTANNVVVSASVTIPTAAFQVLYILNVTQENTGSVEITGAINRKLVTNTNRPIEPAYLQPGMSVLCIDTGSELRMLSYGDAVAIQAAAEAAAVRAEAAAAGLNLPSVLVGDAGKTLVVNDDGSGFELNASNQETYVSRVVVEQSKVPESTKFLRTAGYYAAGDGGAALYKRVVSEPAHAGKLQSNDGAWWEEVKKDGSRTFWVTQRIPLVQEAITTTGYAQEGDGGAAIYKRVATEPTHEGKLQSADGSWWGLVGIDINAAMFGAVAGTNATTAIQSALTYLRLIGGGRLYVFSGLYTLTETLIIGSNTTLELHPKAILRRMGATNCMLLSYSTGIVGAYGANENITVIGGIWDSNRVAYTEAASCMAFGHSTNVIVRGATILNVSFRYHAIECNSVRNGLFEDNYFDVGGQDDIAGECIQIDGAYDNGAFPWYAPYDNTACNAITIRRNRFTNWATCIGTHSVIGTNRHININIYENDFSFSRAGIVMFNWAGVAIRNNRFSGNISGAGGNMYGIHSTHSGNSCSDVIIDGNTFLEIYRDITAANGSRAINISGAQTDPEGLRNVRVTNNYMQNIGRHAIAIENAIGFSVRGNRVVSVNGRGIYSYGNVQGIIDSNHITSSNADPAITIVAVGTFAGTSQTVTNNIVSGTNGGINVSTPWAIVTGNITPALVKTGATGILGSNWVGGAVVA